MKNNLITQIPIGWTISRCKYLLRGLEKSPYPAGDGKDKGLYPFYTSSKNLSKFIDVAFFDIDALILPTGGSAAIHYASGKFTTSTDCYNLVPRSKNINLKFAYYHLLANIELINELGFEGQGLRHLQKEFLFDLPFPLPPLSTQQKIATFLDQKTTEIDNLISKKNKMISLLKEEEKAFINEKLQEKTNWTKKKLKYLVSKIGSGVTPKGGSETYLDEGIIFLRSQNIYFESLKLDDVAYISEETNEKMSGSKVEKGDVLLNITGASIGRCYFWDKEEQANVNQHVCIIRPKNNVLNTQ